MSEWTHALFIGGGIGLAGVLSRFSKYQSSQTKGLEMPAHPITTLRQTNEKKIEEYREQFHSGPIGRWIWACGTFSTMMDEDWEFLPDGTGTINHFGTFHHFRGVTEFEWKSVAAYELSCRVVKQRWLDWSGGNDVWEELKEDEDDWLEGMSSHWQIVRYGFHIVSSDCGDEVAMCSIQDDVVQKGFWFSEFCLSYCKPKQEIKETLHPAV